MPSGFADRRAAGRLAESAAAKQLKQDGWRVLPMCFMPRAGDKNGPAFEALDRDKNWPSPDMLVCKDGRAFFVEVKHAERECILEKTGERDAVMDSATFSRYASVQDATGIRVMIWFYFDDTRRRYDVFVDELEAIKRDVDGRSFFNLKGLRFKPYDKIVAPTVEQTQEDIETAQPAKVSPSTLRAQIVDMLGAYESEAA